MTESGDEGEVVVHDTEVSFLETNILQTIRITITNTKLQRILFAW